MGIGTAAPSEKLDVAGNIKATGNLTLSGSINGGLQVQTTAGTPNVIGGFSGNSVSGGVVGATISGGGFSGNANSVTSNFGTVGGGFKNTATENATVGGGDTNTASGAWATVPGGLSNTAAGGWSFAAGRRAKANHDGAFVWGDSTNADIASTALNQFLVRASGGASFLAGNVGIGTATPSSDLSLDGEVNRTFGMERRTFAVTEGNLLTIQAGGAPVGGLDRNGGRLFLSTGVSTGTGGAQMEFLTATPGASGTADNTPTTKMTIFASGNVLMAGNLSVGGTLSKGGGSFRIDHPLDPANKYLSHSFVESPDMMNVYNGNVRLDANGEAWVELPEWLEALNRDFRYQLTALGAPGPSLHIAEEVSGNRFKIAGGRAGGRVSWQVTGIRQDAYAQAHRIKVEEEKPASARGRYLHPEAHGQPAEKGLN